MSEIARVRLDRWLWAARFFRTRAQAKAAIEAGHVDYHVGRREDGPVQKPKVGKELEVGDVLSIRRADTAETIVILGLSETRRGAPEARRLFSETASSIERREADAARRRMERAGLRVPDTRPSKHDRRALQRLKQESSP